jgi:hypothetical protein
MAREIRGWQIGQVVTAAEMTANTANLEMLLGDQSNDQLPCIYNGLTLQSQSGTGNSIVTFNAGVARCQNLPLSTYTYLPSNPYGTSYPCFIDISTLDSNNVITLSTSITSGFIVATFTINPTTSGQINYLITGSLSQITTGSYNPAIHVKLCAFVYSASTFTLDFTPVTNRDFDWIGTTSLQWNYQNSSLLMSVPSGLTGSAFSIASGINVTINGTTTHASTTSIQNANPLQFYGTGNTNFVALEAPTLAGNTTWKLPPTDATVPGMALLSDGSGNMSFGNPLNLGNVAANDSNVVFTSSSLRFQSCNPTAARTYTLPTTSISAGDRWTFYNQSTNLITLNSSGGNLVTYITPLTKVEVMSLVNTPTTAGNWQILSAQGDWYSFTPTGGWTTNTTYSGLLKRVSDELYFKTLISLSGSPSAGDMFIAIPSPFVVNSSKVLNITTDGTCRVGSGTLKQSTANASNVMDINVWYNGTNVYGQALPFSGASNNILSKITDTSVVSFGSGGVVQMNFSLPMQTL